MIKMCAFLIASNAKQGSGKRVNNRIHQFSCFDQFLAMAFAQLTGRESLAILKLVLRTMDSKLYRY